MPERADMPAAVRDLARELAEPQPMRRALDEVPVQPPGTQRRTRMGAFVFDGVQVAIHVEEDDAAAIVAHQRALARLGNLLRFQLQRRHARPAS